MKSVMEHTFSQIPRAEIPRSVFNRSHGFKTTFNSGDLIPFYVDEALPGDTFNLKHSLFARLATPIAPFMDNLFLETFYFAVPCRLVWEHWANFMGESAVAGIPQTTYTIPQYEPPDDVHSIGSLGDYFGIAPNSGDVNALPFRAYYLIWDEWFRDQNLQAPLNYSIGDGPDTNYGAIKKRNKRHDYFTSALPWPQKGPGVELPLGTSAPVYGDAYSMALSSGTETFGLYTEQNSGDILATTTADFVLKGSSGSAGVPTTYAKAIGLASKTECGQNSSGLYADLSDATAATINSLRQAFQLQKLYERDARGGTRYTELIRSHFGVISPDGRLQRPEYLGGSSSRININPVQQTSESGNTPQGNLAAYGICSDTNGGFHKSFTEHCIIIGLVNVRADITYQQGCPRMFSRQTRFDHYWPALAHLGEQEILNKEIYAQGTGADNAVFGYQERWAEYRYYPSKITGQFRSDYTTPLDFWHLSQEFTQLPTLGDTFIQENPPLERVIAVENAPEFLFDAYLDLKCARPMPVYSVPGYTDHF